MKAIIAMAVALSVGLVAGCGSSSYARKRNETRAMSYLKKFQTATTLHQTEYGVYAPIQELMESDASGLMEPDFFRAWDGHPNPTPLGGYWYATLDEDVDGSRLDFENRVGLCAYPAEPGETGDLIICTQSDPRDFEAKAVEGGFVSHGKEWTFYVANYQDIGTPPRHWLDDDELDQHYTALEK